MLITNRMWHKTLWGFIARDCSVFILHRLKSSHIKKFPQTFASLAGLRIQKIVCFVQKQNVEIRNQTIRNKTMKLPLISTGEAAKKLTENDRLKVLTATVIVLE